MAKSTLATVILPSPHYSSRCGRRIDRITIHHAAGIASARTLGLLFQNPAAPPITASETTGRSAAMWTKNTAPGPPAAMKTTAGR